MKKSFLLKSNSKFLSQIIEQIKNTTEKESLSMNDFHFLKSFLVNVQTIQRMKIEREIEECALDHLRILAAQIKLQKNQKIINQTIINELEFRIRKYDTKRVAKDKNNLFSFQAKKSIS